MASEHDYGISPLVPCLQDFAYLQTIEECQRRQFTALAIPARMFGERPKLSTCRDLVPVGDPLSGD